MLLAKNQYVCLADREAQLAVALRTTTHDIFVAEERRCAHLSCLLSLASRRPERFDNKPDTLDHIGHQGWGNMQQATHGSSGGQQRASTKEQAARSKQQGVTRLFVMTRHTCFFFRLLRSLVSSGLIFPFLRFLSHLS